MRGYVEYRDGKRNNKRQLLKSLRTIQAQQDQEQIKLDKVHLELPGFTRSEWHLHERMVKTDALVGPIAA